MVGGLGAKFTDEQLAKVLDALSNPIRIAIVRTLEEPRCLREIGVGPANRKPGNTVRGEFLARQTVKQHIIRLTNAGIVVAARGSGGRGTEYSLNPRAAEIIAAAFASVALIFGRQASFGITVQPAASPYSTEPVQVMLG